MHSSHFSIDLIYEVKVNGCNHMDSNKDCLTYPYVEMRVIPTGRNDEKPIGLLAHV